MDTNTDLLRAIAEAMPPARSDGPEAQRSYLAIRREVVEQYCSLSGDAERSCVEGQPYASSREIIAALDTSCRLFVYNGGDAHLSLSRDENVICRSVHDDFGHDLGRFRFGPVGEFNARKAHCRMFGEEAIPTRTAEPLGQTGRIEFGPASDLPARRCPIAERESCLLPEQLWRPLLVGCHNPTMPPSNTRRIHPDTIGPLEVALDAREKGIVAIPCKGKVPLVKWKPWQAEMPPLETQMEWFRDCRVNVAILTTGMVLFDIDNPALRDLVVAHCGPTPHVVHTPRGGMHLGYRKKKGVEMRNQVKIKGHAIDIRTDGGIELIPPSATGDGIYEWLGGGLHAISDLPLAKVGWTRTRMKKRIRAVVEEHCDGDRILYRGRRYVDTFERRAVAGAGGHTSLFVAALKIVGFVRSLGGNEAHAWDLLLHFNATKCDPPWEVSDPREKAQLRHKLDDALKQG